MGEGKLYISPMELCFDVNLIVPIAVNTERWNEDEAGFQGSIHSIYLKD